MTHAMLLAAGWLAGCIYDRPWYDEDVGPASRPQPVTVDEVLRLTKAGVGEDLIVSWIRSEGAAARPTSDDILRMKNECVGDRAVEALLTAPLTRPPVEIRYRAVPGWSYWDPYPWGWGWGWPYWRSHYHSSYDRW